MNQAIFDEMRAKFDRGVRDVENIFERHPDTSTAPAAATANIEPTTPEDRMSNTWLATLKADAHNVVERIETIDENALGVLEAIKPNNAAVSITNTLASVAHLPDPQGLLAGADAFLKSVGAALQAAASATAPVAAPATPEPQAAPVTAPAGPVVGGQAQ